MRHFNRVATRIAAAAGLAALVFAQDSTKLQLTARELFYSAAAAPAAKTPSKAAPKPAPPGASKKSATPITTQNRPPDPKPVPAAPAASIGAPVIPASLTAPAPASGQPLGLRYTVLRKSGNDMVEVPASTVFHAGDRIQFDVQTNLPGYLYIIHQGSSGTWKPMFPTTEIEDGSNRVEGWRSYTMPPNARMVFDEQTGTEKIFIVLSREPEPDLERMIYSLQGGQSAPTAPPAQAKPKEEPARTRVMVARADIDDKTVGKLRSVYSRDLIIEKVTPETPGQKKETAVYVVNPTGSNNSRVVADINLAHQ